jgi:hypothetical protein
MIWCHLSSVMENVRAAVPGTPERSGHRKNAPCVSPHLQLYSLPSPDHDFPLKCFSQCLCVNKVIFIVFMNWPLPPMRGRHMILSNGASFATALDHHLCSMAQLLSLLIIVNWKGIKVERNQKFNGYKLPMLHPPPKERAPAISCLFA